MWLKSIIFPHVTRAMKHFLLKIRWLSALFWLSGLPVDSFPKLHRHATLTYEGVEAPQDQKEEDRRRFREMLATADTSLKTCAYSPRKY